MKSSAFVGFLTLAVAQSQQCNAPSTLTCKPIEESAITIDAKLDEWTAVEGIDTSLTQSYTGAVYAGGDASYKCLYSDTRIFLTMEIPGKYRFNNTADEKCAAIATLLKIGANATMYNMGGCPEVLANPDICETSGSIPASCESYRVDIGAHWELSPTEQGVTYGINTVDGTGEDPISLKDDEYSVAPSCRFNDNDENAGNEWAGAWAHTDPTEGANGTYIFELSRLLTTASTKTDAQLEAGGTYSFGIAYWDPYESEDGWTDPGHYITGCANNYIDLVLAAAPTSPSAPTTTGDAPASPPHSSPHSPTPPNTGASPTGKTSGNRNTKSWLSVVIGATTVVACLV